MIREYYPSPHQLTDRELDEVIKSKKYPRDYKGICILEGLRRADELGFTLDDPNWKQKMKAKLRHKEN